MDVKLIVDRIKMQWGTDVGEAAWLDLSDADGWVGVCEYADEDPEFLFPREVLLKMADYIRGLQDVVA